MKFNPQIGNHIIIISIAIILALSSLFIQWGGITISENNIQNNMTINGQPPGQGGIQMFGKLMVGSTIPITGLSGSINLWMIKFPCWLAIAGVIFALSVTITNIVNFSVIKPKIIYTLLYIGLLVNIWIMLILLFYGHISIGGFLFLGSIIICFKQQKSQSYLNARNLEYV